MFKQAFCAGSLSLALLNFPVSSSAVTVDEVQNPRKLNGGWVEDMANILTPATEAEINRQISALEAQNGSEIAVVTVTETAPSRTPKEFATALFNRWHIGKKDKNNGILFLISKRDRRVEIETGYGVEAILPNAKVGNIIKQEITPRFKKDDFDGGTLAGTKALVISLQASDPLLTSSDERLWYVDIPWYDWLFYGFTGGSIAAAIAAMFYANKAVSGDRRKANLIEPEGRSRNLSHQSVNCAKCFQPMEQVESTKLQLRLNIAEKFLQDLGYVRYEGWQCPNCLQHLTGQGMHIHEITLKPYQISSCPSCGQVAKTTQSEVLEAATTNKTGKLLVSDRCYHCSYTHQTEETIPLVEAVSNINSSDSSWSSSSDSGSSSSSSSDSSWSSSSDSGSSSSSSDSSWSSSSDSGSSFGGGDSCGGGDGGSW